MFPKVVVPQNGWFIRENPIRIDDLEGFSPYFWKHPYDSFILEGSTSQAMPRFPSQAPCGRGGGCTSPTGEALTEVGLVKVDELWV